MVLLAAALLALQLAPAAAGDWLDWFGVGAALDTGSAVVVAGDPDGNPAGAWTDMHAGDHSGQQLRIRVMSNDWGAVSLAEVIVSTRGNFEEFFHVDLRAMLVAPTEGDWIDLSVPAGGWQPSPQADWSTVNGLLLRVSSHQGRTGMVAFSGLYFVEERVQEGVVSIAFDDGRSDVFTFAYPKLSERGLRATVYAIPELIGQPGFMTQQELYELHGAGWEIGAHGEHPLNWMSDDELERHFRFASQWLAASGFGDRLNYAYPNGLYNDRVVRHVAEHFETGRTINAHSDVLGYASPYRLGGVSVYPEMPQEQLEQLVSGAANRGEWLTIVFHLFAEQPEVDTQFPLDRFEGLLDHLLAGQVQVMTVQEAWHYNQRIAICGTGTGALQQLTPQAAGAGGFNCD